MPLLGGRHRVGQQGATRMRGEQSQASSLASRVVGANEPQRAPVCESPLFGIRRQLPILAVPSGPEASADDKQVSSTSSPARPTDRLGGFSCASSTGESDRATSDNTLSSIPKHITRQQIHYAFSIMDSDSDGLIDSRDLGQMLANLGIPIDESILAHVLTGASKRGDHRMSESEFLDWLGQIVRVNDDESARPSRPGEDSGADAASAKGSKGSKWRRRPIAHSSSATSSLAALGAEPPPVDSLRKRRGSGSGLALLRSLSSSAGAESQSRSQSPPQPDGARGEDEHDSEASRAGCSSASALEVDSQEEARSDLRAAFRVFDLDGDGYITLDEVRAGLNLLGESWTPAELHQLFNRFASSLGSPSSLGARRGPPSSLRANDLRQRISIEDFVQMLL